MKKKDFIIFTVSMILLVLLIFLGAFIAKNDTKENKMILKAIEEDQENVGNEVLLYSDIKKLSECESNNEDWNEIKNKSDWYLVDIINDKNKKITYIIKITNDKIEYCEEFK